MNRTPHKSYSQLVFFFGLIFFFVTAFPMFISAQDTATPPGPPIEISGPVDQLGTGTITIAGLTVDMSGVTVAGTLVTGTTVTVKGHLLPNNVIVAQTIIITIGGVTLTPSQTATPTGTLSATATVTQTPIVTVTATPSVTPSATPSSNVIIVIEGPVINIVNNFITIYDFDIEVEAQHPILNLIEIGDMIRIEGAYGSSGIVVATVVSNLSDMTLVNGATVSLEGPVESINGNIIVVNGIAVELADNDPLLQTVQVDQFVSVQGNFQNNGTTFVLVVVNIIVNTDVTVIENNCYWKESGMSRTGKWKCDGKGKDKDKGMGKK